MSARSIVAAHGLSIARVAQESSSDADTFWSLFDLSQNIVTFKFCGLTFNKVGGSTTLRRAREVLYEASTGTCIRITAEVTVIRHGRGIENSFELGVTDSAIRIVDGASCQWDNNEPDGDEPQEMAKFIKSWLADLAPIVGKDIKDGGSPVVTRSRYSTLKQYTNAVLKALGEGVSIRKAFRVPKDNVSPFTSELEAIMKKYNVELVK